MLEQVEIAIAKYKASLKARLSDYSSYLLIDLKHKTPDASNVINT